jgi:peptidyl-prolyl cis-trans isomerase A (cyclophilin A)
VQFGINGDPAVNRVWQPARIQDDPVKESNVRGAITFANAGPGTRTTQVFINFKDNTFLDRPSPSSGPFAPFGKVVSGMENVDKIYTGYGENVNQARAQAEGNAYFTKDLPRLDYIKSAKIEGAAPAAAAPKK